MRKAPHPTLSPEGRGSIKKTSSPNWGEDRGEGGSKTLNTMDLTLRHARPGDIPRLCDLLAELFAIESDFIPDREKQAHGLSTLIAHPPGKVLVLVAVIEGLVVGMATVQTLISTAEGGRVGLVEDVIVDQKFRSLGIGTRLFEEVVAWSKSARLKRLQLLADRDNQSALDFYSFRGLDLTRLICLRRMV